MILQVQGVNSPSLLKVNIAPETNIAPENGWLEDEISFWDGLFSGAILVSGSVGYLEWKVLEKTGLSLLW